MYKSLSEMLLDRGLYEIHMEDLLALPEEETPAIASYLQCLVDIADDTDDNGEANEMICSEIERLWDEAVDLLVDETIIEDLSSFWRMLTFMPLIVTEEVEEETDEKSALETLRGVDMDSVLELLELGFISDMDVPVALSDFEAILCSMPDEIIFMFLDSLDEGSKMHCLERLAVSDEGYLFMISETIIRAALMDCDPTPLVLLLENLDIEFNPDINAKTFDPLWAEE